MELKAKQYEFTLEQE